LPCSPAASAASEPVPASLCIGSGYCLNTTRTSLAYAGSLTISFSMSVNFEQNGHWKSLNSMIVTSGVAAPFIGSLSV
jgi:hypothetical protein